MSVTKNCPNLEYGLFSHDNKHLVTTSVCMETGISIVGTNLINWRPGREGEKDKTNSINNNRAVVSGL